MIFSDKETKETVEEEGWVYTGDVGLTDEVRGDVMIPSRD